MTTRVAGISIWTWLTAATAWTGCLYGTLMIHEVKGDWGHDICGPWGCGPPLPALVACHAFWSTLLLPAAVVIRWLCPGPSLHCAGRVLAALGFFSLIGITIWQAATWLPQTNHGQYFGQRVLFSIVTLIELPAVPLLLAGCLLCLPTRSRDVPINTESPPNNNDDHHQDIGERPA